MSTNSMLVRFGNTYNPYIRIKARWKAMLQDAKAVRVLRLSIGSTIAMALAYSINWSLAVLTPVFTVVILSLPLPKPSLYHGLKNMIETMLALTIGVLLTLYLLPMPFVFFLVFGLALFHSYYFINRGGSFWFVLMLLISLLLMPMLTHVHGGLAAGVSIGFIWSGWVAVWLVFVAHFLIPDPQSQVFPRKPPRNKNYVPVAATLAFKSTLVLFPIALLFITFQLSDYVSVMIYSAIFSLSPDLSKGKQAVEKLLISTFIGGAVAYVFYSLLVAVPEYYFFMLLFFLVSLIFSSIIFSGRSEAKYYSSALVAMIVLFNGSMDEGANFTSLFLTRVLLISMAGVYVVLALKFLDRYWPFPAKQ